MCYYLLLVIIFYVARVKCCLIFILADVKLADVQRETDNCNGGTSTNEAKPSNDVTSFNQSKNPEKGMNDYSSPHETGENDEVDCMASDADHMTNGIDHVTSDTDHMTNGVDHVISDTDLMTNELTPNGVNT